MNCSFKVYRIFTLFKMRLIPFLSCLSTADISKVLNRVNFCFFFSFWDFFFLQNGHLQIWWLHYFFLRNEAKILNFKHQSASFVNETNSPSKRFSKLCRNNFCLCKKWLENQLLQLSIDISCVTPPSMNCRAETIPEECKQRLRFLTAVGNLFSSQDNFSELQKNDHTTKMMPFLFHLNPV